MARPSGGKFAIKGTRGSDNIVVGDSGYTINSSFKPLTAAQIDAGLNINGGSGNDVITGGRGADEINGGSDNDTLTGGAGFDKLLGGDGNDILVDSDALLIDPDETDLANPNSDRGAIFDGGRGIDTVDLSGHASSLGIDLMRGSINPDVVYYYDGTDGPYWTEDSQQWLDGRILNVENAIGGSGNDKIWGNWGDNELRGGAGHDEIVGADRSDASGSSDRLFGDAGNDVLMGGSGNDWLDGGTGADVFLFGNTPDSIEGHDTIADYEESIDMIALSFGETGPANWTAIDTDGDMVNDSLYGTYDGGLSSLTILGVTDAQQLTITYSAINWPF